MRLPSISPLLQRTFGSRELEHKTLQTIIDFALHLTFMILTKHPTISPSKRSEYVFYTYWVSSVLNLAMIWHLTAFLLRVLSMRPTPLISSGHVYHQFNTALKLIVWLIRGMSRRAASEKKIASTDSVLPKINTHSESHKIFSMPICLQRPKEAFECGPGPLTHILNGLKCIQIISWKHSLEWSSNFMVEFYEYWPHWAPEPEALYLALTSSWH